jgi:hypothetical protein
MRRTKAQNMNDTNYAVLIRKSAFTATFERRLTQIKFPSTLQSLYDIVLTVSFN